MTIHRITTDSESAEEAQYIFRALELVNGLPTGKAISSSHYDIVRKLVNAGWRPPADGAVKVPNLSNLPLNYAGAVLWLGGEVAFALVMREEDHNELVDNPIEGFARIAEVAAKALIDSINEQKGE